MLCSVTYESLVINQRKSFINATDALTFIADFCFSIKITITGYKVLTRISYNDAVIETPVVLEIFSLECECSSCDSEDPGSHQSRTVTFRQT